MSLGINKLEAIELPKPKYVDNNGIEQDVELEVTSSSDYRYEFENNTNLIKTYFKKNISEYAPVKVVVGDRFFEWTPFGVGFADEHGNEDWFGRINDAQAEIDGNKVIYKDLLLDIDDEFIVNAGELKHNTILNSKPVYNHTLPGRQISVVVDGIIDFSTDIDMFVDGVFQQNEFETSSEIQFRDNNGYIVFTLPPPIAYEVNGSENIQCLYKVIKIGNVISLKIFTPYEWINDSSRVYPVAIDPTLSVAMTSDTLSRVASGTFSNDGDYLFLNTLSDFTGKLFKINRSQNKLDEMPYSRFTKYPSMRNTNNATFSPDDKYLICAGYNQLSVFKYNNTTQDYDILTESISGLSTGVSFSDDGRYLFAGSNYKLQCHEFDHVSGRLKLLSSVNTAYYPRKVILTKNRKHLLCLESQLTDTTNTFKIYPFNNGVISSSVSSVPSPLTPTTIRSFALTQDERYIVFGMTVSPFLYICPFDANTGTIGAPLSINIDLESGSVKNVILSRKERYIIVSQTDKHRFSIHKFNNRTGQIEGKVAVDPSLTQPVAISYSMSLSSDGNTFLYCQDTSAPNALFLYQFFYEPENNVYFKDPVTDNYYSDNKGNTLMLIDFGTIVAGQTTSPKKILLENCYDYAVNNIQLSLSNPSQEFRVELSETDLPFIPQQTLSFNQTLNTRESIPFYIRVTTTDQSQSGGMFEVLAKCDVV